MTSNALAPSGLGTPMASRASRGVKIDCAPPWRTTVERPVLSSHSRSMRLPASMRRSQSTIFISSPGATRAIAPGIVPAAVAAVASAAAAFGAGLPSVPTVPAIVGSTLRTVTGSSGGAPPGSRLSRMPKSAANLASGGNSSVATFSGKADALASARPASSFNPAGSSIRNAVFSGRPGPKLTPSTCVAFRALRQLRGVRLARRVDQPDRRRVAPRDAAP